MQCNNGYTAKYDYNKDEWTILVNEEVKIPITRFVKHMGKLWVEGDVLKWARCSHFNRFSSC